MFEVTCVQELEIQDQGTNCFTTLSRVVNTHDHIQMGAKCLLTIVKRLTQMCMEANTINKLVILLM